MNLKLEHVSARLHTELRAAVDEATYRLWLEPLRVESLTDDTLLLSAPAPIAPPPGPAPDLSGDSAPLTGEDVPEACLHNCGGPGIGDGPIRARRTASGSTFVTRSIGAGHRTCSPGPRVGETHRPNRWSRPISPGPMNVMPDPR